MADTQSNPTGQPLKEFQLTPDTKSKLEKSYGEKVALSIYSTITGTANYFFVRNNRFRKNRLIASGRVNMQQFMDRLDMNGKFNYANINWSAIKLANTAISRMVGRWMGRGEKVQVTAIDPTSQQAKKEREEEAEFVFRNREQLAALQEASGVPMVAQDQFVAEDEDELDQWRTEFNRLPEEIAYELGTNTVLSQNGWYGVLKEKILHDSAEVGLVATYTEMLEDGTIKVNWLRPENVFYSYSEYPDFRDTEWRGHLTSLKISELRAKYGKEFGGHLSEEEIYNIACTAKQYQLTDKIRFLQEWNVSLMRPYDAWNIDIMMFEIRSVDKDFYTVKETQGKPNTIIEKGIPNKKKDNQRILKDEKYNIYKGVYAYNAKVMLEWGLKKNMIVPQDPKEIGNAEFSYSLYMYQNYEMRNIAVPEKIEEPLEQMILARLKMQQLVAKMRPTGAAINVDALQELDLGLSSSTTPWEAQRIWEQTGNLFYRGRDAEGKMIQVPIQELANSGFLPQMEGLIKLYQFHYSVLRDELGVDPNLQQQATAPRVAASNVNNAIQQADDATDYMYDAYLYVMEETAKKVACLLNMSVANDAKKYRDLLKKDDVKGRVFGTKVQMLPTQEEQQILDAMINNTIAANPQFIVYIDPFKIRRIAKENTRLAELYYKQSMKRMIRIEAEKAQANSEQNAQIQQASMQAKAEGDMQLESTKATNEQTKIVLQGVFDLLKGGMTIPQDIKPVADAALQKIGIPLAMEVQQMQQQIAIQQQQAAEEAQMQGEGGKMQEQIPEEEISEEQVTM